MKGRDAESYEDTGYGEGSRYAAHLDRGWSLLDQNDLEAARTAAEHAAQTRPEDPDAAMLLGAIALAEGDPNASLREYERAIDLDPDYLEAYAAAAQVCLLDLDEPQRALSLCEDALSLEDLGPFELVDLGLLAADCELSAGHEAAARGRLATLLGRSVLLTALSLVGGDEGDEPDDDLEIDLGTDRGAALAFLRTDFEGEPLDDEDRVERVHRVLSLSLRLSRLSLDAGDVPGAYELARIIATRFEREPDAWYLLSEAAHRAGDPMAANAAGLRTLSLDLEIGVPDWVPTPAILHRRALRVLTGCGDAEIEGLLAAPIPPALVIRDAPPPELVLEGVDPRIAALALATRSTDDTPQLTGIAVYRQNLARFAGDPERFEGELRWSLLDELTAFLGVSDARRDALGLPPLPEAMRPAEPVPAPEEEPARRTPRRRTKAAKATTATKKKTKAKTKAKAKKS